MNWISTEDRLPNTEVLAITEVAGDNNYPGMFFVSVAFLHSGVSKKWCDKSCEEGYVTHCMPLPLLPETTE